MKKINYIYKFYLFFYDFYHEDFNFDYYFIFDFHDLLILYFYFQWLEAI